MKLVVDGSPHHSQMGWLQLVTIAIATLMLCSCRAIGPPSNSISDASSHQHEFKATQSLSDDHVDSPHAHESQASAIRQVAAVAPVGTPSPAPLQPTAGMYAQQLPYVQAAPHAHAAPHAYATPSPHLYGQPCPVPTGPQYGAHPTDCPCGQHGDPCDGKPGCFNWRPPAMKCPWPADEYLCDGGDKSVKVVVDRDWSVRGLNLEDTVVHYDTLLGETKVTPSNEVCIYAPRFAAARKIYGTVQNTQALSAVGVENPTRPNLAAETLPAIAVTQPMQPNRILRAKGPVVHQDRQEGLLVDNTWVPEMAENVFAPYENLSIIQRGVYLNSDKPRLAVGIAAAQVWTDNQAAQIVVKDLAPIEIVDEKGVGQTFVYDLQGKPRVRLCKIASKRDARPGDIVDFTLRFDNVGDQPVGNVTIIDNLTTRLEYVEGSQQCSLKSEFFTQVNEGDSLVLRWQIIEPLQVKEGGIIRFKCRVR